MKHIEKLNTQIDFNNKSHQGLHHAVVFISIKSLNPNKTNIMLKNKDIFLCPIKRRSLPVALNKKSVATINHRIDSHKLKT